MYKLLNLDIKKSRKVIKVNITKSFNILTQNTVDKNTHGYGYLSTIITYPRKTEKYEWPPAQPHNITLKFRIRIFIIKNYIQSSVKKTGFKTIKGLSNDLIYYHN